MRIFFPMANTLPAQRQCACAQTETNKTKAPARAGLCFGPLLKGDIHPRLRGTGINHAAQP
jgi:hypothetical protein